MANDKQITPEVSWAQRSSASDASKNFIYLTISVPDVTEQNMKLDLQPASLNFTGYSETKKATYHVAIDFFSEIDPKESKINHSARDIEMKLQKKELKEEFWPRLLKDKAKVHYLKTDFDKWVDEDEQDAAPDDDYMNNFGGAAMGEGGFGGLDFSKLGLGGAGGGMPDLSALGGAGGPPGLDGDEEDEEDEDMPELEDEAGAGSSSAAKAGSKIEEIE